LSYIRNVLIAIDQLGNALTAGDPDATISGRVGFHAERAKGSQRLFWRLLEQVIDWAFLPVDGPNHCAKTADLERLKLTHRPGNDLARAALSLVVIPCCLVIGVLTRLPPFTFTLKVS